MTAPLQQLLDGNRRMLARGEHEPLPERRPIAAVLSCTDERVVPQRLFDVPPGRLYMVRVAGNILTAEVAGSLEIAVDRLACPLILVLGHTDCTAVQLAHSRARVEGRAYDVTRKIAAAVGGLPPEAPLDDAVVANVRAVVREMPERSKLLRDAVSAGRLEIAGAVCDLRTGAVRVV
jgi:carbonic anhydrase